MKIKRTNSSDKDFIELVNLLDQELNIKNGEKDDFYRQYNKIDTLKYCVILYNHDLPVSCGAIKEFDEKTFEIKRMYVLPQNRNQGFASKVLSELEKWAFELNKSKCILETGLNLPDAVALYKNKGYIQIPNFGQYIGVENSVCFEKNFI